MLIGLWDVKVFQFHFHLFIFTEDGVAPINFLLSGKDLIEKSEDATLKVQCEETEDTSVTVDQKTSWCLVSRDKISVLKEVLQGPCTLGSQLTSRLRSNSLPLRTEISKNW